VPGSLVILTGASGSGKTTLARALQQTCPGECTVLFFDSVGVPSPEAMKAWGESHQPGGAWQRAMTFQWIESVSAILRGGTSVLLEGQMRIAFIREALDAAEIASAHVILLDCDPATRARRLHGERSQPELANPRMMGWAEYLRAEALAGGCEILDTSRLPLESGVELLRRRLRPAPESSRG
jgi:predicted kinase